MTNLEIIQSTYESKTSEANAENLSIHLDKDVAWTARNLGQKYLGWNILIKLFRTVEIRQRLTKCM